MEVKIIDYINNWKHVVNSARTTTGKDETGKEPSSKFKKQILLAEHSPIRQLVFRFKWSNLLSWVSVHFTRHKIGIEHFVRSQRTDRTGIDRNELKQNELIEHEILINAQSLVSISRKRLCRKASIETQQAWQELVYKLRDVGEVELFSVCVPDCIYRGFCAEFNSCGFSKTDLYKIMIEDYRRV